MINEATAPTPDDDHPDKTGETSPTGAGASRRLRAIRTEIHIARDLERLLGQLKDMGYHDGDLVLTEERSPSGEVPPAPFALVGRKRDAASGSGAFVPVRDLFSVWPVLLEQGKHGIEIKRFKGLGEMDAEQLWETTMDPDHRTLLRVTWDAASKAERLFKVLMGEEVEPRRRYIEEHALEVKNLDV
jgi:DNA gyrase subunit B